METNSKVNSMSIPKKSLLTLVTLSFFMACSPTPKNNRFTTKSLRDEVTLIDKITQLEWVNGSKFKKFDGCKGFPKKPTNTEIFIREEVLKHCEALNFAGHDDWRVPTARENQQFLIATQSANITPYYTIKACPRVIGTQGDKIVTANTHNTKPIGEINSWVKGTNGGIRCVRNR